MQVNSELGQPVVASGNKFFGGGSFFMNKKMQIWEEMARSGAEVSTGETSATPFRDISIITMWLGST